MEDKQPSSNSASFNSPCCGHGEAGYYCGEESCEEHKDNIELCKKCYSKIMCQQNHRSPLPLSNFQNMLDDAWLPLLEREEQAFQRIFTNYPNRKVYEYVERKMSSKEGRKVSKDLKRCRKRHEEIKRHIRQYQECLKDGQYKALKALNLKLPELHKMVEVGESYLKEISQPEFIHEHCKQRILECAIPFLEEDSLLSNTMIGMKRQLGLEVVEEANYPLQDNQNDINQQNNETNLINGRHSHPLSQFEQLAREIRALKASHTGFSSQFGGIDGASQLMRVILMQQEDKKMFDKRLKELEKGNTNEYQSNNQPSFHNRTKVIPANDSDWNDGLIFPKFDKDGQQAIKAGLINRNVSVQATIKYEGDSDYSLTVPLELQQFIIGEENKQMHDPHQLHQERLLKLYDDSLSKLNNFQKHNEHLHSCFHQYGNQENQDTSNQLYLAQCENKDLDNIEAKLLLAAYHGNLIERCKLIKCIDEQGHTDLFSCHWKQGSPLKERRHILTIFKQHYFEGTFDEQFLLTGSGTMLAENGRKYAAVEIAPWDLAAKSIESIKGKPKLQGVQNNLDVRQYQNHGRL
ncbi:hypothetical protein FGO68_gene1825 [Halteria grandinella]|uniref:Uncharacterized protein n=1 Tax=Halteria grandinella TaxID=5974 RepID=A0A8J8NUV7_HALGN|nr:hypothetical protein FGO68_gene1825 [Halteria grandinella]